MESFQKGKSGKNLKSGTSFEKKYLVWKLTACGASCSDTSHCSSEAAGNCLAENFLSRQRATDSADSVLQFTPLTGLNSLEASWGDVCRQISASEVVETQEINVISVQ